MMHRYFLIEPSYTDIDTFCNFTVGSGRVRANIQIYADDSMLAGVVFALTKPDLEKNTLSSILLMLITTLFCYKFQ